LKQIQYRKGLQKRALLAILITVAFVPQMFVYEIIEITVPCSEPMIVAVLTEFGKNTEFYRLYTVVTGGLFFVIPFCIVFVCSAEIIAVISILIL
jgi:hypothetical protein